MSEGRLGRGYIGKNRFWRVAMSLCLFWVQGLGSAWAEKSFWDQRRQAAESAVRVASLLREAADVSAGPRPLFGAVPPPAARLSSEPSAGFTDKLLPLVSGRGALGEVFTAPDPAAPFVVIFQDAHENLSAQRNVSAILSSLGEQAGV